MSMTMPQNEPEKVFDSIFVVSKTKIWIFKCGSLAFLGAKMTMTKTNDHQQFLAQFEWFLSLFQISDVKHEFLLVKLKVHKNGIFRLKFLKKFPRLFLFPNPSYVKKLGFQRGRH